MTDSAQGEPGTGDATAAEPNPLIKLAIEAGPLVLFFVLNSKADIFWATGGFMIAILVSLAASWRLEKRLPVMPLVTAVFVLIFGGLTLLLQDEEFIKIKTTIVNSLFGSILLGGLAFRKSLLEPLFGTAFKLTPEGWRTLTFRWALFFFFLAGLNEVVRLNFSKDFWVNFKVWGIMPITIVFTMTQLPLIQRTQIEEEGAG